LVRLVGSQAFGFVGKSVQDTANRKGMDPRVAQSRAEVPLQGKENAPTLRATRTTRPAHRVVTFALKAIESMSSVGRQSGPPALTTSAAPLRAGENRTAPKRSFPWPDYGVMSSKPSRIRGRVVGTCRQVHRTALQKQRKVHARSAREATAAEPR
jgi:hypothetical protein